MTLLTSGAFAFGLVIGWVTYRTIRRSTTSGLGDIATVIGAVGGAAVTALFPSGSTMFGAYALGLAVGFFTYFVTAVVLARVNGNLSAVNEWMGETVVLPGQSGAGQQSRGTPSGKPEIPTYQGD